MSQIVAVSLDDLVSQDHLYRKFLKIWDFEKTIQILRKAEKSGSYKGYGVVKLFKCLLLQFMENLSDRELEKYLVENNAAKFFCGFELLEKTPDHTVFCRIRQRIGTTTLSEIFKELRNQLKSQGYMNEIFNFVDATHLISKSTLWKERDEAIQKKYEKLNNKVLPKVAKDKQARIGCKGKNKYWYGYKKSVSVDMQSGLINKVTITKANVPDAKALKHICPSQGAIYADKGYCTNEAKIIAKSKGCHLAAIKKNNMKTKNKDLDKWYSKIRSPYERVFSKQNKRTRYMGVVKNQFAAFMDAICFNLKRIINIEAINICIS
jgi:IS5 family transposase